MKISSEYENLFTAGSIKLQPLNIPDKSAANSNRFISNRSFHRLHKPLR